MSYWSPGHVQVMSRSHQGTIQVLSRSCLGPFQVPLRFCPGFVQVPFGSGPGPGQVWLSFNSLFNLVLALFFLIVPRPGVYSVVSPASSIFNIHKIISPIVLHKSAHSSRVVIRSVFIVNSVLSAWAPGRSMFIFYIIHTVLLAIYKLGITTAPWPAQPAKWAIHSKIEILMRLRR